jgi:N,N'-diacetylchitobiose transport system substrate-binding protein
LRRGRHFQNTYSTPASRDTDTKTPDQDALFASGKTATILDTSVNTVLKDNPALKGADRHVPVPRQHRGIHPAGLPRRLRPGIAAKSPNQAWPRTTSSAATSTSVQTSAIVGIDGWTPVSTQLIDQTSVLPVDHLAGLRRRGQEQRGDPGHPGLGHDRER